MDTLTPAQAREYRAEKIGIWDLPEYDMAEGVVSFFLAYDSYRREKWAEKTGYDKNMSYRVWGDEDLKGEWVRYVKVRVLQGGMVYKDLVNCLIFDDREEVVDYILRKAHKNQVNMKRRFFPPKKDPFLDIDTSMVLPPEVFASTKHGEVIG